MRKITSLFIILALVVSLFTFCVSAEETLPAANVTDEDISRSVKLETLGVITNEFDLKGYATRGDMAQIVADYISVPESNTKSFKDISCTVSSMRLDCVLSAVMGKSRAYSSGVIEEGLASVNYEVTKNTTCKIKSGDIISVKGFGKAVISTDEHLTKKGRIHIEVKKYV